LQIARQGPANDRAVTLQRKTVKAAGCNRCHPAEPGGHRRLPFGIVSPMTEQLEAIETLSIRMRF